MSYQLLLLHQRKKNEEISWVVVVINHSVDGGNMAAWIVDRAKEMR